MSFKKKHQIDCLLKKNLHSLIVQMSSFQGLTCNFVKVPIPL